MRETAAIPKTSNKSGRHEQNKTSGVQISDARHLLSPTLRPPPPAPRRPRGVPQVQTRLVGGPLEMTVDDVYLAPRHLCHGPGARIESTCLAIVCPSNVPKNSPNLPEMKGYCIKVDPESIPDRPQINPTWPQNVSKLIQT